MEFLKNNRRFSFLYGGKPMEECGFKVTVKQTGDTVVTEYLHKDGLKVTNTAHKYADFGAYEWVNEFENTAKKDTQIISELYDCDVLMPIEGITYKPWCAYAPTEEESLKVYAPLGSLSAWDDFYSEPDKTPDIMLYDNYLYLGESKTYSSAGGRSSAGHAPFFNVHKNGKGFIFAVGWTGQWNCKFSPEEKGVRVQSKIEDTHFKLLAGEKIRTSSAVIMPYGSSPVDSQNKWRRLVKKHFSLMGKEGRHKVAPLSALIWGGMHSDEMIRRLHAMKEYKLPIECFWLETGWYGNGECDSPDAFTGDWGEHNGNWEANKKYHPDDMRDVIAEVEKAGQEILLWFEPERATPTDAPIADEHPEYFLHSPEGETHYLLLDYGNEKAWQYTFDLLCEKIEKFHLDIYRQDFNIPPLNFWRKNDAPDRRGITEIKHITGMYRLWDALLEKYPHLLIDNCAGGGKRIDVETLRRSVPLWRSDAQVPSNSLARTMQCNNMCYAMWLPYSGMGTNVYCDAYNMRSSYTAGVTLHHSYYVGDSFGEDPEQMKQLKKYCDEYLKVRPYMYGDYYPLTETTYSKDVWCAMQFDRPEEGDGILQVFRRENAPYSHADFVLHGLDKNGKYEFEDADGGAKIVLSGKELITKGFSVAIDERPTAKLWFYKKV